MSAAAPERCGSYQLVRRLGAGGMAETHLAVRRGPGGFEQRVCLKRIHAGLDQDPEFVRLFLAEARLTARLRHANIAQVLDFGIADGQHYLVLEYIEGVDLKALLSAFRGRDERLSPGLVAYLALELAAALDHAHDMDSEGKVRGVVHRDISPSNVLLSRAGEVKLADFGVAKALDVPGATHTGAVKGKVAYMAPEYAGTGRFDARSDLFALGVLLYECLTGKRPYDGPSDVATIRRAETGSHAALSERAPSAPKALITAIERLLAPAPDDRFPSAASFARAIEAVVSAPSARRELGDHVRGLAPPEETPVPEPLALEDTEASPIAHHPRLPDPAGTFVGRAEDLELLGRRVADGARLITLRGTAGIGKSRLAVELARTLAPRFAAHGGARYADLTQARDVHALTGSVAQVLGVPMGGRESSLDPVGQLGRALASHGPLLLVLDNFDHVVEQAATTVARWLSLAPAACCIVTSRERLQIEGEWVHELLPLSLPGATSSEGTLSPAEQLLLDRAARAGSDLSLGSDDASRIAEIACALEGNPLAIELAAARLAFLGPATLLERLREGLRVLGKDQSRLFGTIELSWNQLSSAEKAALAQCSVFSGGFDLEAAEAVLDLGDEDAFAIDQLEALYNKSLVRVQNTSESTTGGRFDLYRSIREFARERLGKDEEAERATFARHAAHYAARARAHADEATGPAPVRARDWILRERDNLSAAVQRGVDADASLDIVHLLYPVLSTQGPLPTYLELLDHALEGSPKDPRKRTRARITRADVLRLSGKTRDAIRDLEAILAEVEGDAPLEGEAMGALACALGVQGQLEESEKAHERAIALLEHAGKTVTMALTWSSFGAILAGLGRIEDSRAALEQSLALHARTGNLREEGMVSAFLGNLSIDEGRLDEARIQFAHAMSIHEQVDDRFGQAFTTANLAILRHRQGELEDGREEYHRALDLFREIGALRYEGAFTGYLGLLEWELAGAEEGCGLLREACRMLKEAGDERFEVLFSAYLGGTEAALGLIDSAKRRLARAEEGIAKTGDPLLRLAVSLQWIPIEHAEKRRAEELRDTSRAATLAASIASRLEDAQGEGSDTPATRSGDVAFSLRVAERVLGPEGRAGTPRNPRSPLLRIDRQGQWFEPPGGNRVDLSRRGALANILRLLLEEGAGSIVTRERLIQGGWPGERILRSAAGNRVRVAISTLRRLGLGDAIETVPDGYMLSSSAPISVV